MPGFDWSPMVGIWELTRACDLACHHCRARATPGRAPGELTTAESLALLDQWRELDPGVLVFTGGDPFKRPDVYVIVEGAVRRGLTVAITPSVTPLLSG